MKSCTALPMTERDERMSTYVGGNAVFPGSFNPPHVAHIKTIRLALACFDVLHMFVRYNESVELVDWETKKGWFDRINEEVGGRLVIHRMENPAVKGKTYTMEDFFDFIRSAVRSVGEPVSGFVFGDDYEKLIPVFQKEFPRMYFFKGEQTKDGQERISSTAIREDLEGHRSWLPEYVYETLHGMREDRNLREQASVPSPEPEGTSSEPETGGTSPEPETGGPGDLETVDVTGCPVVGKGFGSTVYLLDEKTIIKVYKEGTPLEKVQKEYALSRIAFLSGVPCVRVYRMARVGDAFALVLERLSSSLGSAIHQHPEQIEAYVDRYVALAKQLHATRIREAAIPTVKDKWLSCAKGLVKWCSPEEVTLVCDLVTRMPDADTLAHLDFHPGNIMFRGEDLVLIDVEGLSKGSYLCDLAVTYRGLIMGPQSKEPEKHAKNMGMDVDQVRETGDLFFMKYLGLGSRKDLEEVYSRLHVLYALNVVVMCGSARMKDDATGRMIMDVLLRKVLVPGKETVLEIWKDGALLPVRGA